MREVIDVTDVVVVADHRLRLSFADGSVGEVDFSDRTWGGVFEPLRDADYFSQVTLDPELGTIVWPNGTDVAPETLYELATRHRGSI
jgi:hypothetical protein